MPRESRSRFSPHLEASLAYLERIGYVPGDPSPLIAGRPVPGCRCPDCTGLPSDHPARRPALTVREVEGSEIEAARRVDILEVARLLGLELRRTGGSYRGACPVHDGDGPNFAAYPRAGRWRCYVCDARGDTIELVRQVRGLGFREAIAWLLGREPRETEVAA